MSKNAGDAFGPMLLAAMTRNIRARSFLGTPPPARRGRLHSRSWVGPGNKVLNVTILVETLDVTLGPRCNLGAGVSALLKLKRCLQSTSCLRFLPESVEYFQTLCR